MYHGKVVLDETPKIRSSNRLARLAGVLMLCGLVVSGLVLPPQAKASSAVLSLSPSTGTFVVGSTFDVSIYLDTQGQNVNTIELNLKFPADRLQLVSSSTGKSIIGIWTSLPKYDNASGTLSLVGGVPNGIVVGKGLITTLTFRVRGIGSAIVKFDNSRVLLNDGMGTELLTQTYNSIYDLVLPPPQGPIVVSDTHPDQTKWYNNANPNLTWADDLAPAQGYSYVLNELPIDTPDDISEGDAHNLSYHNISDGRHYFHIKALRNGQWGGVTHFAIDVDTSPPADFKIQIIPSERTSRQQPVIQFATTDAFSGMDHYELKIIPLNKVANKDQNQLFIEAESPYVPDPLDFGEYDVIVRAYDKAGNTREVTQRLTVATAIFQYVANQGLAIRSNFVVPWLWVWMILLLLLLIAAFVAWRVRHFHLAVHQQHVSAELPEDLRTQMDELQKYRSKYGKLGAILLIVINLSLLSAHKTYADNSQSAVLAPPVITTVSRDITNNEIFYIGGKTGIANSSVVVYLQNSSTTETLSKDIPADINGEWFYRWDGFLVPGNYVVWTQTKDGQQLSPPSPQIKLTVESAAVQFGATRFTYTAIYMFLFVITLLILLQMIIYIIYHFRHGRRKHKLLMNQVSEAEASVRRGFAVLNRDLESELAVIRQARLTKELSAEEKQREDQLLADLKEIEQYLSKEIWEIEDTEIRA